jgi:hypothetical protein
MFPPFYGKTIRRDIFFYVLRFLHFTNNDNAPDTNDLNYDRLWQLTHILDLLNAKYSKYYTNLMGRIIFTKCKFRGYICFTTELYTSCDMSGHTHDMDIYLRKDRACVTTDVTVTHTTQNT